MSSQKEPEKTEPELPITKDQAVFLYRKPTTDKQRAAASKARATQLANRRKLQEWREAIAARLQILEERIRIVELDLQAQEDASVTFAPSVDMMQKLPNIEKEETQYIHQNPPLPLPRSQMTISKTTQTPHQLPVHVEKTLRRKPKRAHQLW